MSLEKEFETYENKLPELKNQEGKFVLIRGEDIAGFFTSYEDAMKAGYEKFKLEPFLVKQVNSMEQVQVITRLIEPCHILHSS